MTFDTRGRLWVLTSPTYPHVGPDEDAERQADHPRGQQRRRPRRHGQGLRRQALHPDRLRAGRRRRLHLAAAEPDVPAGHQRRRSRRRAPRHPARLRHRGQPPLDSRLHLGPGRRPLLPGGHLPALAGRDAVRAGPRRLRRRVPLRAAHREAERLRHVSVRQPVGPRHRSLGPELHQRRLERQQLLGHRVLRPRRLSEQAEADEGVDADPASARPPAASSSAAATSPTRRRATSSSTTRSASRASSSTRPSRKARASSASRSSRCCSRPIRTSARWRCSSGRTARSTSSTGSIRWSATCSTRCAIRAATRRTAASGASPRPAARCCRGRRSTARRSPQQLELLKAYEDRTRYQARLALRDRPTAEVLPAVQRWIDGLDADGSGASSITCSRRCGCTSTTTP